MMGLRSGPVPQVEGFARGPYPLAGDLQVAPHQLSRVPQLARLPEQRYDFATGELNTRFRFGTEEGSAEVEVTSFCSRSMPTVVLPEVAVTVDRPLDLVLTGGVSYEGVPGRMAERSTDTPGAEAPICTADALGDLGRAEHLRRRLLDRLRGWPGGRKVDKHDETAPLRTHYSVKAQPGTR